MKSHLGSMLIFSVLVSLVFAFIAKHDAKERLKYFLYLLASFVLLSVLAGWLMFSFPL